MILLHKVDNNQFHMWLEMKKSGIEGVCFSLVTYLNFHMGEVIPVYCGEKMETAKLSKYLVSNGTATLDCALFLDGKIYLGGHLTNDLNWGKKKGGVRILTYAMLTLTGIILL